MFTVSKTTLIILSGCVWLSGAIVLLLKAASLSALAIALRPGEIWPWLAITTAVIIGGIKARYLFGGFCRKNLDRIAALDNPQLWQAFRPAFYLFLAAMVLLGATLTNLAIGNYPALLALVVLDISVGFALLASFPAFFRPSSV